MTNQWEFTEEEPISSDSKWVKIIAHIKRVDDGVIHKYETSADLSGDDEYPDPYIWTDGNYACDCNRELFFEYADGKEYGDIETECTESRFEVNLENPVTGEIYYREFDDCENAPAANDT